MKDSQVEWIGKIPEEWEIRKISWSFSEIRSGSTPSTTNDEFYNEDYIPWIVSGDLCDDHITVTKKFISP